jgi:hypothetical protein
MAKYNQFWRGVRAAEGARLESVCTLIAYRGFESLPLRQQKQKGSQRDPFCLWRIGRNWIRTRGNQNRRFDQERQSRDAARAALAARGRSPVIPSGRRASMPTAFARAQAVLALLTVLTPLRHKRENPPIWRVLSFWVRRMRTFFVLPTHRKGSREDLFCFGLAICCRDLGTAERFAEQRCDHADIQRPRQNRQ